MSPRLAQAQLIYLLIVIIWGAFVRATGSGAGCGNHWPLCNGEVVPLQPNIKTWIEYGHRVTSGLSLVFCVLVFWLTRKSERSILRKAAAGTLFFLLIEALIGAVIVKLEHVLDNRSIFRGYSIGIHLVNTFLLTASAFFTAYFSTISCVWKKQRFLRGYNILFSFLFILFLFVGASGAVTALGDTLFVPTSSTSVWLEAQSPDAHWLQKIRIYHPFMAMALYLLVIAAGISFYIQGIAEKTLHKFKILFAVMTLQVVLGYVSIMLLAPVYMQLLHLLFGQISWLCFLYLLIGVWFDKEPTCIG